MRNLIFLCSLMISVLAQAQSDSVFYNASNKEIPTEKKVADKKVKTYSITITVTNIRNHKGVIRFKFFDDSTPFPHDTGFRKVVVNKSEIIGDSFTVTYDGFISRY